VVCKIYLQTAKTLKGENSKEGKTVEGGKKKLGRFCFSINGKEETEQALAAERMERERTPQQNEMEIPIGWETLDKRNDVGTCELEISLGNWKKRLRFRQRVLLRKT